ncbi:MAG: hypothetical protein K2X43_01150 [Hyphomonadaceae bacterium]|nr:hypothetical protein [Hyphomonadaceae bacterium]
MTKHVKSTAELLLSEIEAFMAENDMPATTFGALACRDNHLVRYLRAGRSITTRRLDQCREFMRQHRRKQPQVAKPSKTRVLERAAS